MTRKSTRSKIVCTIGPASRQEETLVGMIDAGMDVARINLSHEDHSTARETLDRIRSIDESIAILFDLQGPKIRLGDMDDEYELQEGDEFILTTKDMVGDQSKACISYEDITDDVKIGNVIAVNDGLVRLEVTEVREDEVVTKVTSGGPISSRKGVNIPGIKLSFKTPTEKDLRDLDLAAEIEPDLIALSFVTDVGDVTRVNEIIEANGPKNVDVISKIEHTLAVKNYDEILKESHGVMIARGDLGIEVPVEDVPVLQRDLVRQANMWARPAIVATHMLESMTHEKIPTRAEVSDVAHAIFDRADAVMLSGETAMGRNPVAAVQMMEKIVRRAEKRITPIDPMDITSPMKMIVEIIGNLVYSAVSLIQENIDGIVCATRSGFTARWLSKFRPNTDIFAVTRNPAVVRRLRLLWGVQPVQYEHDVRSVDDLVKEAVQTVYSAGLVEKDQDIVFTSGIRHIENRTNILGIFHICDLIESDDIASEAA